MSNAIFREQRFVESGAPPTVVVPVLATLSGLTTATTSVAHTSTVTLNSPADQTYTITWSRSNSGTGSATSTITAGNTTATTISTWSVAGSARTVGFSISPSITKSGDPLTIVVSEPVATTATLSGGTSSGTTNSAMTVTVTLNGAVPLGGFTATLGRSGVAGSLGTSSLVFTFGGPKTLSTTNTNTADGASSVTMTSGGLAPIGTPQSYTSSTAAVAPTGLITQYLTSDGGSATYSGNFSGPTRDKWHNRLGFAWKRTNTLGNWLDAAQTNEGSTAYATSTAITAVDQEINLTATALVSRWKTTGHNRGAYLRVNSGSAFPVAFYGRTDGTVGNRPKLVVVTTTGTYTLIAAANAYWYNSSFTGTGAATEWRLASSSAVAVLRFDLSTLTGSVTSATLTIKVKSFPSGGSTGQVIGLYECDPPTIIVPEDVSEPVYGLANDYVDFNAWKNSGHASLLSADDFETGGPFDGGFTPDATRIFDSATSTTYARGTILGGSNGSANSRLEVSSGTGTQGIPNVVRDEVYGQYWMYLESDFGTTQDDAIKIPAMGVQFGYWVPSSGGYWQQTTGNGGAIGTGLKVDRGGGLNYEYQGHSVRFLTGTRPTALDDDPYNGWFGIGIYPYNLDQGGPFPPGEAFPYVALRLEKQYCFDIRVKQNTMTGAQDGLGNYATANADGIYQVWINGLQVYSRTNYRWRKHAEFGVQGVWIDVYHGGTSTASQDMHYRVDRVSLATSYIGPKFTAPSWRRTQPVLTWTNTGNTPITVDPEANPAINPNYPGLAPWRSSNGGGDIYRAWESWCSGIYNDANGRMRVHGGGHDDYAGNEVYAVDIFADSPTWILERAPTGAIGNTGLLDDHLEDSGIYFDGRPRSSHTYGNLVLVNGEMWLVTPAGNYRSGQGAPKVTFKFTGGDWVIVQSGSWPVSGQLGPSGSGCFDSSRNRVYYWPSDNTNLSYWDVAAGTATGLNFNTGFGRQNHAVYIPELDIQVCLTGQLSAGFVMYDYGRTAGTSSLIPGATGSAPAYAGYDPGWFNPNGVWVPGYGGGVGAILCWHGGTGFNLLTPPAVGNLATTPWAWSTLAASGSNIIDPGAPNQRGVYSRLFYSKKLKGIGLSKAANLPIKFFALE